MFSVLFLQYTTPTPHPMQLSSALVSLYLGFLVQITCRSEFAAETGGRVRGELKRRRPAMWQLFGEVALGLLLTWHTASLIGDLHRLFTLFS